MNQQLGSRYKVSNIIMTIKYYVYYCRGKFIKLNYEMYLNNTKIKSSIIIFRLNLNQVQRESITKLHLLKITEIQSTMIQRHYIIIVSIVIIKTKTIKMLLDSRVIKAVHDEKSLFCN